MKNLGNKAVLAKNLSYYMERSGKSQREMAEIVGVAKSTFSEWIAGNKYPRIDKIEMLANYFGILKSDLIEEKSPTPDKIELTESEAALLMALRQVPEEKRQMAVQMFLAALKTQE